MTNQTPNSKIAEILAVFDDIAYRPNSYDFDKAATQLQQLMIEARIDVWRAILGVDFDQFYPEDKYKDFISVPSHWINQEISEYKMQAQLNKENELTRKARGKL